MNNGQSMGLTVGNGDSGGGWDGLSVMDTWKDGGMEEVNGWSVLSLSLNDVQMACESPLPPVI